MMLLLRSWSFSIYWGVVPCNGDRHGAVRRKHVYSRNPPRLIGSSEEVGQYHFLRSNASPPTLSSIGPRTRTSSSCFSTLCTSNVEVVEIIHNKVLIAAAASAAIGQLLKPFTSTILGGNNFDFKNAFQAGGFPSTHSSAAVATATILGLERGFSDAIFGLAVVYAALVMYDAQGVRREVGSQAKVLNRVLFRNKPDSFSFGDVDDCTESFSEEMSSNLETREPRLLGELKCCQPRLPNPSLLLKSDNRTQSTPVVKGDSERIPFGCTTLKESVGHTEIEVIAGALLGFFVSLAVCRL